MILGGSADSKLGWRKGRHRVKSPDPESGIDPHQIPGTHALAMRTCAPPRIHTPVIHHILMLSYVNNLEMQPKQQSTCEAKNKEDSQHLSISSK